MSREDRQESRTTLFSIWLHELNLRAEKELGISIFELPEADYYQAFEEDRLTISQMIKIIREEIQE
jgi:hypothetical protein